jgi:hypothetical protein
MQLKKDASGLAKMGLSWLYGHLKTGSVGNGSIPTDCLDGLDQQMLAQKKWLFSLQH